MTRSDAVETLGVSPRMVTKLLQTFHVEKPVKAYLVKREATKIKWDVHKKFATDFIGAGVDLEEAALRAGVDPRQMRRIIKDLLQKHFGMEWKDMTKLTSRDRSRLADEIETKENLDLMKINTINAIQRGQATVEEIALDAAIKKRGRRGIRRNGTQ